MKKDYQKPQMKVIELDTTSGILLEGSNNLDNDVDGEAGAKGAFGSWDEVDW